MNTPFAITLGPDTALTNKTGAWRTMRPRYVSLLPPCSGTCPAGEDVLRWLSLAEEGRYEDAWRALMEDNPLPAVHGRVCYHPCESACNRGGLPDGGGPVSIHAVERFLGDLAIERKWTVRSAPASGQTVMVVGSGPCGLSCAYHLARLGHDVEVHEAARQLGGMMRYGIPAHRLPRQVLEREIGRLEEMGIRFVTCSPITDVVPPLRSGRVNGVFLAVGAGASRHIDIPAHHAGRIIDALPFLRDSSDGAAGAPRVGRRVAVYGGGNTAMDAARVARRLGAEEAVIIYRRDAAHAPAHPEEIQQAIEEGVVVRWLTTIKAVDGGPLTVEEMRLDESGAPVATGRVETLEADTLILAVGQDPRSDWLRSLPGVRLRPDGTIDVGRRGTSTRGSAGRITLSRPARRRPAWSGSTPGTTRRLRRASSPRWTAPAAPAASKRSPAG